MDKNVVTVILAMDIHHELHVIETDKEIEEDDIEFFEGYTVVHNIYFLHEFFTAIQFCTAEQAEDIKDSLKESQ